MKYILSVGAALVTAVSAHSWLECTDYDNSAILEWMKANATTNTIVDPGMPWFAEQFCKAYPRNKVAGGNWIDESTNYIWNIAAQRFDMGAVKPPDTHACPPGQRSPTQLANAPMATKAPGDTMKLYFGGNGHTRGYNAGGTSNPNPLGAGSVSVYWKGAPEQEINDISEFTKANLLQTNGFSEESFSYPLDQSVKRPEDGLVDKGNWQTIKLPSNMAPGRHALVWVWTYAGSDAPQWSTCFDVMIQGAAKGSDSSVASGSSNSAPAVSAASAPKAAVSVAAAPVAAPVASSAAAVAAPAPSAPAAAAPAAPAITRAPKAPKNAAGNVIETVYETVDVWTTIWDYAKRSHIRQFRP